RLRLVGDPHRQRRRAGQRPERPDGGGTAIRGLRRKPRWPDDERPWQGAVFPGAAGHGGPRDDHRRRPPAASWPFPDIERSSRKLVGEGGLGLQAGVGASFMAGPVLGSRRSAEGLWQIASPARPYAG